MTISNSLIANNTTLDVGGGITNSEVLTLAHSTVINNSAGASGGGILSARETTTVIASTIANNTAGDDGGGIQHSGGTLTVTNSTISGNTAGDNGGGVSNFEALVLLDSTLTGNTAAGEGGGLYQWGLAGGTATLERSLISGNTATTGREVYDRGNETVTADNFNLFGYDNNAGTTGFTLGASDIVPGAGVLLADILDINLAGNGGSTRTHALVAGGPAVDAATNCPPPDEDQRGVARPQGFACDSGAFELRLDGLGKAEQKCINAVNKTAAGVSKTQLKESRTCVKNAGKGKEPDPAGCLIADVKGKVAKAGEKVVNTFEQRCTGAEPILTGPVITNNAHVQDPVVLIADDLFSGALNAVAVAPGKDEARCQDTVVQQAGQLWNVMLNSFNQCKKNGLKDGSVVLPSSLQTECMTPSISDPNGKIAKTARKMADAIGKRCAEQDTDALFPGRCAEAPEFAACVEMILECRVCRTLNQADGTNRNCDELDDGAPNSSCPTNSP